MSYHIIVAPASLKYAYAWLTLVHTIHGNRRCYLIQLWLIASQNHSCEPNCKTTPCWINEGNPEKPLLTLFTCEEVAEDQELTFSYWGPEKPQENERLAVSCHWWCNVNVYSSIRQEARTDPIYEKCRCGASTCIGVLFK